MDADQLIQCGVNPGPAGQWAGHLSAAAEHFGIQEGLQTCHWLAQIMQESRALTSFEENLNYSVESLRRQWPNRISWTTANRIGRIDGVQRADQRAIANFAYGGRYGNGDVNSGDGWRYRGRGPKQITFKDNYRDCGDALQIDLIGDPDQLLVPEFGALSAGWYWDSRAIGPMADADDIEAVTRAVNGGTIGLAQRSMWLNRCKAVFL